MVTFLKVILILALLAWLGYEIYQLVLAIKEKRKKKRDSSSIISTDTDNSKKR